MPLSTDAVASSIITMSLFRSCLSFDDGSEESEASKDVRLRRDAAERSSSASMICRRGKESVS